VDFKHACKHTFTFVDSRVKTGGRQGNGEEKHEEKTRDNKQGKTDGYKYVAASNKGRLFTRFYSILAPGHALVVGVVVFVVVVVGRGGGNQVLG